MTLLATAAPVTDLPVAWHQMAWAVWRRLRSTLLSVALVVAGRGHRTHGGPAELV